MNYYGYGYSGGYNMYPYQYGYGNTCCQSGFNGGNAVAIILVLFILLVVVFGAGFLNYQNN